ncbi:hypothetical protein [Bacteriovorax sp. Seq25_V]|uniref:hypothetical protein n=1 Tax=Bacteriovorax sp. Seq25_V TaxID=1201288 RepID=UPI000389EEDF|nr:hypothetical protein [Bacteriovorax sp. Seq25_V]EQC46835.1 hypothetical protein M900_2645 [Bacteriovorax sp. Seq25_V]
MKTILAVMLSLQVFANLPWGNLENVNATYSSPEGKATAKYLNLEGFGEYSSPELFVKNNEGILVFSFEDKKFEIDLSLFAVNDADNVKVKNLNLVNNKEKINLNFDSIYAKAALTDAKIHNVEFDCKREAIHDDMYGDLFQTCFTNSDIFFKRFDYYSEERSFKNFIDEKTNHTDIVVKNIEIHVKDERFNGKLESNLTFGIDVRFDGEVKYYADKQMVELKVDSVRASLFSIRSKVFKELDGNVPDNIVVDEPYIRIYIP